MFKECFKDNLIPFIIDDSLKMFYYRGGWKNEKGYLTYTCLHRISLRSIWNILKYHMGNKYGIF